MAGMAMAVWYGLLCQGEEYSSICKGLRNNTLKLSVSDGWDPRWAEIVIKATNADPTARPSMLELSKMLDKLQQYYQQHGDDRYPPGRQHQQNGGSGQQPGRQYQQHGDLSHQPSQKYQQRPGDFGGLQGQQQQKVELNELVQCLASRPELVRLLEQHLARGMSHALTRGATPSQPQQAQYRQPPSARTPANAVPWASVMASVQPQPAAVHSSGAGAFLQAGKLQPSAVSGYHLGQQQWMQLPTSSASGLGSVMPSPQYQHPQSVDPRQAGQQQQPQQGSSLVCSSTATMVGQKEAANTYTFGAWLS